MEKNKMAVVPLKKLFLKMGLPMIISMVLQALYNVIDSVFITNMGSDVVIANQALTLAFPIQLLIIAIGVGTGVGINALLSKSLGEQNKDKVNKIAGTGIFLSICIYVVFLVFGLFGSEKFIRLFAGSNQKVIEMGTTYLKICCCFSYGSIGFTVYERFLQSTGKTHFSTIAQISGAVTNIILDYIFIYPMKMGVAGAALATIIGQFVSLMITLLFELLAHPLSQLFGLSGSTQEMIDICSTALHIASLGFVFMGISIAIQGVLQSIGYAIRLLIIALLRLVIFVFPIAYFFTLTENVTTLVWWTFPISELLTVIVSFIILKKSYNERISPIKNESITNNLVIAISREHGTNGKEIARQVAKELNIEFYDKERIKEFALKHGFVSNKESEDYIYSQFLSLDINKNSIILLSNVIKEIAKKRNCVIVGRAADYILKEDEKLVRIFLYAPLEYRLNKVMEIYHDSHEDALRYIHKSDYSRKSYYEVISNKIWGDKSNYDLCLDCKLGNETIKDIICNYVKSLNK